MVGRFLDGRHVSYPNYSFVRCDRSSNIRGGGIITYIHKDVPYSPRHDLTTQTVESACIEIKLPFVAPILITNVYRPPSADSACDSELGIIMEKITSENKECFVLGDFNINFLCLKSNSLSVIKSFQSLGLKQLVTEPTRTDTYYTYGSFSVTSTLIDHIYVLSKRNVASVYAPTLSMSDHYPVLVVRRCNVGIKANEASRSTIQYRSLASLDETKFREDLP